MELIAKVLENFAALADDDLLVWRDTSDANKLCTITKAQLVAVFATAAQGAKADAAAVASEVTTALSGKAAADHNHDSTYAPLIPTPVIVSTTTYTILATDHGKTLFFTHASGCEVTIPANATLDLPPGFYFNGLQAEAGQVTVVGAGAAVLTAPGTKTTVTAETGAMFSVIQQTDNVWWMDGDLAPV